MVRMPDDHQDVSTPPRANATADVSHSIGRQALSSVRWHAIFVVFLLCFNPGFSQQVENDPEAAAVIRGTVVNKLTHDPISHALVYSRDNHFATLTDGEGHFEFRVPKQNSPNGTFTYFANGQRFVGNGPLSLTARKPGYLDDPVHGGVPLSPGVDTTIALIPEAIIQGRVLVSSAEPAPRITLQLFKRQVTNGSLRWVGGESVHTNSSGEFRFAELGPGEYKIMTLEQLDNDLEAVIPSGPRYGFPPSYFPGVPDFYSGASIQLSMGQKFDANMTLVRQPYFPVRIPVAGVDPRSGVSVSVFAQGHPGPGYRLGYNNNQHRVEGLLPSGTYLIQATTYGPDPAAGVASITVAGRELYGPVLAMASTSAIPVHVKEEFTSTNQTVSTTWNDGKRNFKVRGPRAYLNLYLEPAEDFSAGGGVGLRPPASPDDLTLEVANVLPGRYWVHVNSSRGYAASITAGDVDLRQDPLVVSLGGNSPIEIIMRDDAAKVEGKVTARIPGASGTNGLPGEPIEVSHTAWIYCVPVPGSTGEFQAIAASLSLEGKFTLPVMIPGAYRVMAFDRPHPEFAYREPEAMRPYDTLGQVTNLVAGQTVQLELDLIPNLE